MRYILSGMRREQPSATVYVSRNGCATHNGANAAVIGTLPEARKELDYWQSAAPVYRWTIESLPPRVAVATAVLRARPVETELA